MKNIVYLLVLIGFSIFCGCQTPAIVQREQKIDHKALCTQRLHQALLEVEKHETNERVQAVLSGLGSACPEVLGNLADAAQSSMNLPRAERATALAQAASSALPPACSSDSPLAPAESVQWSCPPPDGLQLSESLLKDLDVGSYLFVIAVRARLDYADVLDDKVTRLLNNLLLSAALQGEAQAQ